MMVGQVKELQLHPENDWKLLERGECVCVYMCVFINYKRMWRGISRDSKTHSSWRLCIMFDSMEH